MRHCCLVAFFILVVFSCKEANHATIIEEEKPEIILISNEKIQKILDTPIALY